MKKKLNEWFLNSLITKEQYLKLLRSFVAEKYSKNNIKEQIINFSIIFLAVFACFSIILLIVDVVKCGCIEILFSLLCILIPGIALFLGIKNDKDGKIFITWKYALFLIAIYILTTVFFIFKIKSLGNINYIYSLYVALPLGILPIVILARNFLITCCYTFLFCIALADFYELSIGTTNATLDILLIVTLLFILHFYYDVHQKKETFKKLTLFANLYNILLLLGMFSYLILPSSIHQTSIYSNVPFWILIILAFIGCFILMLKFNVEHILYKCFFANLLLYITFTIIFEYYSFGSAYWFGLILFLISALILICCNMILKRKNEK